jgi:hypothetical protein
MKIVTERLVGLFAGLHLGITVAFLEIGKLAFAIPFFMAGVIIYFFCPSLNRQP